MILEHIIYFLLATLINKVVYQLFFLKVKKKELPRLYQDEKKNCNIFIIKDPWINILY